MPPSRGLAARLFSPSFLWLLAPLSHVHSGALSGLWSMGQAQVSSLLLSAGVLSHVHQTPQRMVSGMQLEPVESGCGALLYNIGAACPNGLSQRQALPAPTGYCQRREAGMSTRFLSCLKKKREKKRKNRPVLQSFLWCFKM